MAERILDIDWADLELAFRDTTDAEGFLDTLSGEVVTVMAGFDDERDLRDKIAKHPSRYLRLPVVDATFTRDALRSFTLRQRGALKQRLDEIEPGPGAIAAAMSVLREDKAALTSFSRFEQSELWKRIERFLADHGIKAGKQPPALELFPE